MFDLQLSKPSTQLTAALALLGIKVFYQPSQLKWRLVAAVFSYWNYQSATSFNIPGLSTPFLLCSFLVFWTVYAYFNMVFDVLDANAKDHKEWLRRSASQRLRPRFFVSWTTHLRLYPLKVKFTYPLLFVGFSTDFKGSIGHIFTVKKAKNDNPSSSVKYRPTFFSVDPSMFANPHAPFEEKFATFLERNGIDPTLTPHSYVATIPRFCNFGWCPSTCYYFYTASFELVYAILEVNNTFGENHLYLIRKQSFNAINSPGFTYSTFLPKDFHISPFAERSGGYIFSVLDPLVSGKVDVHVAIFDKEGKKTMTARFKSEGQGIDLLTAGWVQTMLYVACWGGNAFLAIPRTFWQAWKTYMSRKVLVTARPEVKEESGGRFMTPIERACQDLVLRFIQTKVEMYPLPVALTIGLPKSDPVVPAEIRVLASKACADTSCTSTIHEIKIIITNPAFFTKFVSQSIPGFCYLRHTMLQHLDHRTILVSDWDEFLKILVVPLTNGDRKSTFFSFVCSTMLFSIRFISGTLISGYLRLVRRGDFVEREQSLLTSMDRFMLEHSSVEARFRYVKLVFTTLRDEFWEWVYVAAIAGLKECGINIIWTN